MTSRVFLPKGSVFAREIAAHANLARFAALCLVFVAQFVMAGLAFGQSAGEPGTGGEETCYIRDGSGNCLDDAAVPTTGQFLDLSDRRDEDGNIPTSPVSQHHANVRLTQDTFVYAHDICRWVGNENTRGRAVFIGLETKDEWVSFINNHPEGSAIERCCKPVTVSVCGATRSIGFGKAGSTFGPFTGGHNFSVTYRCDAGAAGIGATADTSWSATSSGNCTPPTQQCRQVWEQNDRGAGGRWITVCDGGGTGGNDDDGNEKGQDGGTQSDRDGGGGTGGGSSGGQP